MERVPSSFEDHAGIETIAEVDPLGVDAGEADNLMPARSRLGTRIELLTSDELG